MDKMFTISVGRGGESDPFMSHSWDKQEHDIKYFAFGSFLGSADWKMQYSMGQSSNLQFKTKPEDQYTYHSISEEWLAGIKKIPKIIDPM